MSTTSSLKNDKNTTTLQEYNAYYGYPRLTKFLLKKDTRASSNFCFPLGAPLTDRAPTSNLPRDKMSPNHVSPLPDSQEFRPYQVGIRDTSRAFSRASMALIGPSHNSILLSFNSSIEQHVGS